MVSLCLRHYVNLAGGSVRFSAAKPMSHKHERSLARSRQHSSALVRDCTQALSPPSGVLAARTANHLACPSSYNTATAAAIKHLYQPKPNNNHTAALPPAALPACMDAIFCLSTSVTCVSWCLRSCAACGGCTITGHAKGDSI